MIRLLEAAGRRLVRVTGSHHHFRHSSRPGTTTVVHPLHDIPLGTLDLPGCTSTGLTVQETARNAEDALQAYIDLASEHGDPIPDPSELDRQTIDPDIVEAARILVRVELPGSAVRVNITLPEELLASADRYAARTGYSRSGLLAQAVRERMRAGS